MIIRLADFDTDALAIVEGAKDFISRVRFQEMMPDDDKLTAAIGRIVTLPGMEITVAEHDGEIVGGLGMLYAPYLWNPDLLTAEELFWWAAPDAPKTAAMRLFRKVKADISAKGAVPVFRALETSPPGVAKVYERAGMTPIETIYMGAV